MLRPEQKAAYETHASQRGMRSSLGSRSAANAKMTGCSRRTRSTRGLLTGRSGCLTSSHRATAITACDARRVPVVSRKTGNLRACQLLLGHRKLESTIRRPGIEVDDALEMSEQIDL